MKLLIFHVGLDRYGLRLNQVQRVLPLLALKQLPLAADAVVGLMDLHGQPVPVIDLCRVCGLAAAADHFDTRIIVVDYPTAAGSVQWLGLRAERVLGVQQVDETKLVPSTVQAAPFLGPVASADHGLLQLVELEHLLPASLRATLFPS